MKRNLVKLFVVLLLCVSFGGVFAADAKKIVIGVSLVQKDSDWWNTMGRFTDQAYKAEGWETVTIWAAGDQQKQIKDVEDLVAMGIKYIVLGPIQAEGSMVAVDAATKAGIPVVTIGRLSNTKNAFGEIIGNDPDFGKVQMDQIHKDYPNGANIVYLFGPVGAGYAVQMWEQGTLPKLAEYPKLKILEQYKNPSDITSDGMKSAEDAIVRYGDKINVIAATNDGLALGAVRAVQAAGLGDKIKVYGAGLTLMGIEAVHNGTMRFTALRSQAKVAEKSVEYLKLAIKGEKPAEKRALIPPVPVTRENVLTVRDAMFGGTVTNPETWKPKK